jgi:hypothetical protein
MCALALRNTRHRSLQNNRYNDDGDGRSKTHRRRDVHDVRDDAERTPRMLSTGSAFRSETRSVQRLEKATSQNNSNFESSQISCVLSRAFANRTTCPTRQSHAKSEPGESRSWTGRRFHRLQSDTIICARPSESNEFLLAGMDLYCGERRVCQRRSARVLASPANRHRMRSGLAFFLRTFGSFFRDRSHVAITTHAIEVGYAGGGAARGRTAEHIETHVETSLANLAIVRVTAGEYCPLLLIDSLTWPSNQAKHEITLPVRCAPYRSSEASEHNGLI